MSGPQSDSVQQGLGLDTVHPHFVLLTTLAGNECVWKNDARSFATDSIKVHSETCCIYLKISDISPQTNSKSHPQFES